MLPRCNGFIYIYNTKSTGTLVEIIKIVILSDVNAGKQAFTPFHSHLPPPTKQNKTEGKTRQNTTKRKMGKGRWEQQQQVILANRNTSLIHCVRTIPTYVSIVKATYG